MPPLSAGDDRPLRAVRAIEQLLPWVTLRFEISYEGAPIALTDRDRWLLKAAARGQFPLIANDDEARAVTIYGLPVDATKCRPICLSVSARFPEEPEVLHRAAELVATIGVALGAWWGDAAQEETGSRIIDQIVDDNSSAESPPPGLPRLASYGSLDGPEVPGWLGWANYWSQATCRRIGFPDPTRHAELLQRARPADGGGWVVQLTDESLDLDIPAHVGVLARAYDLLPAIGGRDGRVHPIEPVEMVSQCSIVPQPWNPLIAEWHAPPLGENDDRYDRAVRMLEHVMPATLRFAVSAEMVHIELVERTRFLRDAIACGELPLLVNRHEDFAISGLALQATEHAPSQIVVLARFPEEPDVLQCAAELVEEIGIILGAWWGSASQSLTRTQIALPAVPEGMTPHHLGWINYWSKATCARIGFPDPARHAELLKRARRVEGGGWVVQITDESLDLDIPAHLQALARAYDLLPAIGGRDIDTGTR